MTKIAMLSTGEEVLYGDIVDTNAAWLSRTFFESGFSLTKRSTVGDSLVALKEEILMLSFNCDVVIVNGGLGPTSDDLSAEAAAASANEELVLFPEWLDRLTAFFNARGVTMPESNVKQAMLPSNASIVDNPIGTACGFQMLINDCLFYFTPGVPKEFELMVETQILPDLQQRYPDSKSMSCSRLYTLGTSESVLSDKLDKIQLPEEYMIGYRSYLPFIEVKLFAPKGDLDTRVRVLQMIYKLIESNVVSVDENMLAHLGHLIAEKKQSVSISEQSTQGWLSNWLHSNSDANPYCGHSWVMSSLLDVSSQEKNPLAAAFALAGATREKCATDISLVTGKLEDEQFSIALSTSKGEWGQTLQFNRHYSKEEQKELIATITADMLRRYLSSKPMFVQYSSVTSLKDMFIPSTLI
ncbi:CinA family nicotinamide mononucleotide deamidase-related protein [Vibrio sp. ZSDE26]|uniref:CinA-like protein n=1 Tax=Vibrio amylolyticus TaxID=2847292 RepID=A0A9X1XLN5_9VIBR|nr:CinA family nicotinamide mononucleotide deamidase-related protein [Vibrio amylolyticus]MCK6265079.1 CinA family nicotinamide mononucleotide deamidase-related protein [Vibrio amylolyticus]